MKKSLIFLPAIAAVFALLTPAQAGMEALDYARTVYVPFGQMKLKFVAPLDMCFLSNENLMESALISHMQQTATGGQVQAVFTNCLSIGSMQGGSGVPVLPVTGTITWLNPSVGETSKMDRAAFLDKIEKDFLDSTKDDLAKYFNKHGKEQTEKENGAIAKSYMSAPSAYHLDDKPHRTDDGVSIAYTAQASIQGQTYKSAGVVAQTLIHHVPVQVSITFADPKLDKDLPDVYEIMDTFLAQQVTLNE